MTNVPDYPGLDFDRKELARVMRENWDDLIAFAITPAFNAVYAELMGLPEQERPAYVTRVLLRRDELETRGVVVPDGILIQVSAFGDRRPTLFAIKKYLPAKYRGAWENVNLTFDNNYENRAEDPEVAWRPPLPVLVQSAMMSAGLDLESAPPGFAQDRQLVGAISTPASRAAAEAAPKPAAS